MSAELIIAEALEHVYRKYGNLDHDDLTQALQEAKERLRLIEEQIERNNDFFTQLQAVFTGDVETRAYQNYVLQRLKDQVENEIEALKEKIDRLEWFVVDVSKYFSDSLEVMRLATRAAIELNKVAVEADGSYYTNGVDFALILADLENEGLTSGDIKVTKLTETSYTIEALPGHPEYPGTVEFTVRTGANGHNFHDVKAGFEKSTPEGWDDAYSLFTGLLWTGYAANLQAAMGHPPLPAKPPQK